MINVSSFLGTYHTIPAFYILGVPAKQDRKRTPQPGAPKARQMREAQMGCGRTIFGTSNSITRRTCEAEPQNNSINTARPSVHLI